MDMTEKFSLNILNLVNFEKNIESLRLITLNNFPNAI